jgi:hypothetical protein
MSAKMIEFLTISALFGAIALRKRQIGLAPREAVINLDCAKRGIRVGSAERKFNVQRRTGMVGESSQKQTHAARVRRRSGKKSNQGLPPGSKYDWPANLNELLEWYSDEVFDVSRAAQMRIHAATKIVTDYTRGEISLEEAAQRLDEYDGRWRDVFHGGVDQVRGMTDEEIYKAMDEAHEKAARRSRS